MEIARLLNELTHGGDGDRVALEVKAAEVRRHQLRLLFGFVFGVPFATITLLIVGGVVGSRFGTWPVVAKRSLTATFGIAVNEPVGVVLQKLASAERSGQIDWFALEDPVFGGQSGVSDPHSYYDRKRLAASRRWIIKTPRPHESIELTFSGGRVKTIHRIRVLWPYSILDY